MAMAHPGVGDPLGFDNPYSDGRPNWNLQSKARIRGPSDNLSSNGQVKAEMTSGYGNDMARTHTQPSRSNEQKGMRHYDEHLARTTRERQERGINMPVHFSSGYERADRPIGRHPVDSVKHLDPKDGGVWEPVQRQYPKVPRVDYGNGVKITAKPINNDRPVDIWPASITVRDTFKPGGLRIFEGKRQTNKNAFPNAMGYTPPRNYTSNGTRIDYSSVDEGGPFGIKKLHNNSPLPLPDKYQERYLPDTTSKSKTAGAQGILNKELAYQTSGPHTGRHGAVFPFRPASGDRRAPQATGHSSSAQTQKSASATQKTDDRSMSDMSARPPRQPPSQMEPMHMPPPPSYGRRAGSSSSRGSARTSPATPQTQVHITPKPFSPRAKQYHEFPLTHASNWTFVGGFRP